MWEARLTICCNPANITYNGSYVIGQAFPQDKVNGGGIGTGVMKGRNGYFWGIIQSCTSAASCSEGETVYYAGFTGGSVSNGKGVITPPQAQAFDNKIDDGQATAGNVYAAYLWGGDDHVHPQPGSEGYNCITNASPPIYNISYGSPVCNIWINMQGGD